MNAFHSLWKIFFFPSLFYFSAYFSAWDSKFSDFCCSIIRIGQLLVKGYVAINTGRIPRLAQWFFLRLFESLSVSDEKCLKSRWNLLNTLRDILIEWWRSELLLFHKSSFIMAYVCLPTMDARFWSVFSVAKNLSFRWIQFCQWFLSADAEKMISADGILSFPLPGRRCWPRWSDCCFGFEECSSRNGDLLRFPLRCGGVRASSPALFDGYRCSLAC